MAARSKEATFVADWNKIVDFKITEENLRAPNYRFLFSTLESLLRHLNYDINAIKESVEESHDAERLFNIKFVNLVNSLYQLTDQSHRFYYFDLIEPTTKKTLHVLKCLFNYLSYYCMVKENVISQSNAIIHDYNVALKENNALQTKIEKFKRHEVNSERNRVEYEQKIPIISAELAELKAGSRALIKAITEKTEETKEFEANVMKMEMQMVESEEKIVSDEEYEKRVRTLNDKKKEAAELEASIKEIKKRNDTAKNDAQNYVEIVDELNSLMSKNSIELFEEICRAETKLKTSQDLIEKDSANIKVLTKERDDLMVSNENCISILQQQKVDNERVDEELKAIHIRAAEEDETHKRMLKEAEEELARTDERINELRQQKDEITAWFQELWRRNDACFQSKRERKQFD